MGALGLRPASKPLTHSLSWLQSLLELGPRIIVTKETRETSSLTPLKLYVSGIFATAIESWHNVFQEV